jgi:hypothetical protein
MTGGRQMVERNPVCRPSSHPSLSSGGQRLDRMKVVHVECIVIEWVEDQLSQSRV